MKVLVTGARGFIGSHVVRALVARGDEVIAPMRGVADAASLRGLPIERVECDLANHDVTRELISSAQPEACVHAAWCATPGVYLDSEENFDHVAHTAVLARALARAGCRRLVGIGTCAEYDTDFGWLSETTPMRPARLYAAAKLSTHLMLEQFAALSGMSTCWARLFFQYGPHEHEQRIVASVIRSLLRGEPALVSPGEQVRDFLHVEDVGNALATLVHSEARGAFNVGSGAPLTVRALVETIGQVTGRSDLIRFGARSYGRWEPMFIVANASRLRTETSWKPEWSLEAGVRASVAWWSEQH